MAEGGPGKKKRDFTPEEIRVLLKELKKRKDIVFGENSKEEEEKAWQEVTDAVNEVREAEQVEKAEKDKIVNEEKKKAWQEVTDAVDKVREAEQVKKGKKDRIINEEKKKAWQVVTDTVDKVRKAEKEQKRTVKAVKKKFWNLKRETEIAFNGPTSDHEEVNSITPCTRGLSPQSLTKRTMLMIRKLKILLSGRRRCQSHQNVLLKTDGV
ncbi:hypothetical protein INR49_008090 [Caranx melampygus]|nr:hypothetical protein INR49_008090 [Caranx melampygus]